jgi:hypothetical protein
MYIIACLRDDGVPVTGLAPKLYGWEVATGKDVLNDETMTELGASGIYRYNFSGYDKDLDYAFLIDAGSSIANGNERYQFLTQDSLLAY